MKLRYPSTFHSRSPEATRVEHARLEPVECVDVAGLEGLLDPRQPVLLERVREPDRERRVPGQRVDAAVPHQHRLRPDPLAQQADQLDVTLDLVAEPGLALLPEAELAAPEAELVDVAGVPVGLRLEARRRGWVLAIAGRRVVMRAAEELGDG